jgi:hypothetical protein
MAWIEDSRKCVEPSDGVLILGIQSLALVISKMLPYAVVVVMVDFASI